MVRQRQRHRPRLPERIPLLAPTEPASALRAMPFLHPPLHRAGAERAAAQRDLSHRRRLPADHDDDDGRYRDEPQCARRLFGRQWECAERAAGAQGQIRKAGRSRGRCFDGQVWVWNRG
jgi:hypothetical protein